MTDQERRDTLYTPKEETMENKRPTIVRLNVRIPQDIKRRAKAQAALEGKTLSDVVRELVTAWLEEKEKKPEG